MATTDKDFGNKHYGPLIATCIGSFVVIMAFAFWQGRPLFHWAKNQRALQQVDQIYKYLEEEKFVEAGRLAAEAYQLGPSEPEVLRVCSRVAFKIKSKEARFFLEKLVDLGADTYEDRRALLETNLGLQDTERAGLLAKGLLEEAPDDLELLRLVVKLHLSREDPQNAIAVLARIINLDPKDLESRLLCARLLIMHGGPQDQNHGWQFVWSLAQSPGEIGLAAIDLLLQAQGFAPDTQAKLLALIAQHPLIEERHQIGMLRIRTALEPANREAIIDAAMSERRDLKASDQAPFFAWLSKEGEYAYIADHLTLDHVLKHQVLLVIYINALGHTEGWKKARELLSDPSLPLSEVQQLVFIALCDLKLGEDEAAIEESLQKSLHVASRLGSFDQAFKAGRFAEAAGLPELAEMAYRMAQRGTGDSQNAFEGLMRIAEKQKDTAKLRSIAAQLHYRQPKDPDALERFLYLNALSGIEIESTLSQALSLIEAEPLRITPRVIAGLAYLRMHNISSAFAATESCDPAKLTNPQKIVCAAIAAAADRPQVATQLASTISTTSLLTEEERLLPSSKSL